MYLASIKNGNTTVMHGLTVSTREAAEHVGKRLAESMDATLIKVSWNGRPRRIVRKESN